jgi:hypothetical protein
MTMMMLYHVLLPALAGLVAHHGFFIHGEWHLRTAEIIGTHLTLAALTFSALFYYYVGKASVNALVPAASTTAVMAAAYLSALFTSMTVYRLFFHATRHFPGPKLAAVSKFWHIFHIRDSRNFLFLEKLHKQYGNLVRTGMPVLNSVETRGSKNMNP